MSVLAQRISSIAPSALCFRPTAGSQKQRLGAITKLFGSLSYESVVKRGFAVVRDERDTPLSTAKAARKAGNLSLEFRDDRLAVSVEDSEPPKRKAKPLKRKSARSSSQGNLF